MAEPETDVVVLAEEPEAAAAPVPDDAVTIDEAAGKTKLPDGAELLPDGSVRLVLRIPVTVKYRSARSAEITEERTEELRLHRLTGGALRAIQAASPGAQSVVALSHSARMSEAKFAPLYDRMDAADANAAAQVVLYFLEPGPKTGR